MYNQSFLYDHVNMYGLNNTFPLNLQGNARIYNVGMHGDTRWGDLLLTLYIYTYMYIKSLFTGLLGEG